MNQSPLRSFSSSWNKNGTICNSNFTSSHSHASKRYCIPMSFGLRRFWCKQATRGFLVTFRWFSIFQHFLVPIWWENFIKKTQIKKKRRRYLNHQVLQNCLNLTNSSYHQFWYPSSQYVTFLSLRTFSFIMFWEWGWDFC
jgi:hypothetical protein